MKFEPLSHCPAHCTAHCTAYCTARCTDQADPAVLRADFGTHTRTATVDRLVEVTGLSAAATPGFVARMRIVLARLFGRDSDAVTRDHGCRCDVEARLLELETRKLNAQILGNPRD